LDVVVIAVDVVATRRGSLVEESVLPVGEIVIDVTEVGVHVDESIILLLESVVSVATSVSRVEERGFPVPECRPRA
jgi:hypothetical protein